MQDASSTESEDTVARNAVAYVDLLKGLLPVWSRHLATSRAQSESAVVEMMKAFADIGPHINMAERQSQQINDALAQPVDGVMGLANACEQVFAPVLADASLSEASRLAIVQVLGMVRSAVEALEQIAKPFQHETQMVAAQVDRMYMGFQYQDRVSQMMSLLESDFAKLQGALSTKGQAPPDLMSWLAHLESQYAMAEQHSNHHAESADISAPGGDTTTFF